MHYRAERDWEGLTAVIVAGGESFTAAQARLVGIARARDLVRVIAVNDAVYPCWFADVAYACDARWWAYHQGLPGFKGLKVSLDQTNFPDVHVIANSGTRGFDPDPGALRSGGNSGYQALHLAAHRDICRAILLGFDFKGEHWFGRHPDGVANSGPPFAPPNFKTRREAFIELKTELDRRGVSVVNASPGSVMGVFSMVDLEQELDILEARHAGR